MPSFLADYRTYVENSECSTNYHIYCALVALSSLASFKVWTNMGYFTVRPNMYVVLVGPPGNRKTSAMSICKQLLHEVGGIPASSSCVSREALMLEMADDKNIRNFEWEGKKHFYSPLTCCVTELSNFISVSGPQMIDFLTTIYDEPRYKYKTKNKGECFIEGPYLTLLGCTTPDWITARLRDDVISGGFSRRALFVYETGLEKRVPFPTITEEMSRAWHRLVAQGTLIRGRRGEFTWDPAARSWYDEWYKNLTMPRDVATVGYYESKHVHLIKISMLLALSEGGPLVHTRSTLDAAMEILKIVEDRLNVVFQGIGRNELNAASNTLMAKMESVGGAMTESEARSTMFRFVNAREFDEIVRHLLLSGKLRNIRIGEANGLCTIRKYKEILEHERAKQAAVSQPGPVVPDQSGERDDGGGKADQNLQDERSGGTGQSEPAPERPAPCLSGVS